MALGRDTMEAFPGACRPGVGRKEVAIERREV